MKKTLSVLLITAIMLTLAAVLPISAGAANTPALTVGKNTVTVKAADADPDKNGGIEYEFVPPYAGSWLFTSPDTSSFEYVMPIYRGVNYGDAFGLDHPFVNEKEGGLFVVAVKLKEGISEASLTINISEKQESKIAAPSLDPNKPLTNVKNGVQLNLVKSQGLKSGKYCIFVKDKSKWKRIGTTGSTVFVHKEVVSGKKYTYTVRIISKDGTKYLSGYNSKGWSITYIAPPKAPVLKNTKKGVQITWKKVAGAAKYRIFRKAGNGKWTKLADTSSLKYVDKKAKKGVTYRYTIRCISKNGKSYTSAYDTKGTKIKCKR